MENDTRSPLLDLPAELRLEIYSHVLCTRCKIPLRHPRSRYIGLLYACRQIQSEFEPEILKSMQVVLARTARESLAGWDDEITFSDIHCLHDLENLTVHGSINFGHCTPDGHRVSRQQHPLRKLLYMHFNALAIRITSLRDVERHAIVLRWLFKSFCKQDRVKAPFPTRFRLDWSEALVHALGMNGSSLRVVNAQWAERVTSYQIWHSEVELTEDGAQRAITFERLRSEQTPPEPSLHDRVASQSTEDKTQHTS